MATEYEPFKILIDGGEGDIHQREYEQSVKWSLDLINHSKTGQALLTAIKGTGKWLTIEPWRKKEINAETRPNDWRAATARGELRLGAKSGKPLTSGWWNKKTIEGTGEGSHTRILYAPTMFGFGGSSAAAFAPTLPGIGRAAVLVHEMAHAYRNMNGHSYLGPTMGGRAGYDNEEDFFAIVLTNIFVTDPTSAVQVRTLRADHRGFAPLAAALSTSKGFLQDAANKRMLSRLFTQEPGLTNDLLGVNATFNPVKECFRPSP